MVLTRRLARFQRLAQLGFPPRTAGVRHVVSPIDPGEERRLGPALPARCQPCVLHILLHPRPPDIPQGRQGRPRLAPLCPRGVPGWHLVTGSPRFNGFHLRMPPLGALRRRLRGNGVDAEGREGEREGLQTLPLGALSRTPARDFRTACLHAHGALAVVLASGPPRLGMRQRLLGVAHLLTQSERRTLPNIREAVKEGRPTQARPNCFGQLDQGRGALTDQRADRGAEGFELFLPSRLSRWQRCALPPPLPRADIRAGGPCRRAA
jgi:hypothetical protein